MASKKYVVYLTYGVYVDTDTYDEEVIISKAVQKLFEHGVDEVTGSCDAEIEDVTAEFESYDECTASDCKHCDGR